MPAILPIITTVSFPHVSLKELKGHTRGLKDDAARNDSSFILRCASFDETGRNSFEYKLAWKKYITHFVSVTVADAKTNSNYISLYSTNDNDVPKTRSLNLRKDSTNRLLC